MKQRWAIWGLWCVCAWARLCGEVIVVGTYNVENYAEVGRRVDGVYEKHYPKPEEAKRALRQVLALGGADLWALQEMGTRQHLEELQRDLKREGLEFPHSAWVEGEDKERHVAVLSKRPLKSVVEHNRVELAEGKGLVKRGLLEVRLAFGGVELTVFVVHLKSRRTEEKADPDGNGRRGLEAEAVRKRIAEIFPDPAKALYLLAGDFNDGPRSRPVRALLTRGKTDLMRPVKAADRRGETWTHHFLRDESYSKIDYILASTGLWASAEKIQGRLIDEPVCEEASDHRPVVVTLEIPNAQASASTVAP